MKRSTIKNRMVPLTAALCAACFSLTAVTYAQVEMHPKIVGASIDFGEIVKGQSEGAVIRKQTLTRTGVYLTSSGTYDKNLDIFVTIGGLFWYPMQPGEKSKERLLEFGPGVGQAEGIYSFGNPEKPAAKLKFGLFSVKYTDATNLGEYLYRSGTYPGFLVSGGWSYINSASYLAQGAEFSMPTFNGQITHDVTLFMERDYEPTSDLSPGYVITYKPTSYLEFGGGIVWSHAISLNPDRLAPKDTVKNGYSKVTNKPLYNAKPSDTAGTGNNIGFYTFRGFKTMARASIDIGSLLGTDLLHAGDFKLYAEMAILGLKNQPYYYDKITDRMPMMLGMNIPTFGLLTRLSVEGEYHKSKFPNTVGLPFYDALPVPLDENTDPYLYQKDSSLFKKDDWHWSVYATRKITTGIAITAQAASDHQRQPTGPEAKPTSQPVTLKPSDWYYVVRLDFGLF